MKKDSGKYAYNTLEPVVTLYENWNSQEENRSKEGYLLCTKALTEQGWNYIVYHPV